MLGLIRSLFISIFLIVHLSASEDPIKIVHTQDHTELYEDIQASLAQAQKSILILTFTLSDAGILELLNQKAEQGIHVTVVIDKDHQLPVQSLKNSQIEVLTRFHGEGRVHHKILVVDQQMVWIGSANFSNSAYSSQENVMVRILSPELAQCIHQEADVFRGATTRESPVPPCFSIGEQVVSFGLLPHDGFPAKKTEVAINKASKALMLDAIANANDTIQIAMMVWTDPELAQAVIEAKKRGVVVEVLAPDFGGVLLDLKKTGIDVRINPQLSFMHNKMMMIDHKMLINGSANWSKSSFSRNDESFIVLDPLTAEQQEIMDAYWNYLWPH